MFINVAPYDFSRTPSPRGPSHATDWIMGRESQSNRLQVDRHHHAVPRHQTPLREFSPYLLSNSEAYLWNYFDQNVTPQCVLDPSLNPYRNIILRMALSSPGGPLFHCVLASAANQLNSLGHGEYLPTMWMYRARALRHLRGTVGQLCSHPDIAWSPHGSTDKNEAIACALMLCFFDDCSESWTVHSRFVGDLLFAQGKSTRALTTEEQSLHNFALTYVVSHDILASTAASATPRSCSIASKLCCSADPCALQTLTGCSQALLLLISEINSLGCSLDHDASSASPLSKDQKLWRDDIERRLHQLRHQNCRAPTPLDEELWVIAQVKLQAAIMYLYARIDHASPQEPCMFKLTSQILSFIPKVSLRTNTILWPLFVVATLGVRPESDDDRRLVWSRLAALQSTRQLGNVKKARQVIERVWNARDLRPSDAGLGWALLQEHHASISLA
ncbi:fungal-specific transcription factor domain-containing protein [Xylariomycetidae sp. FL0641]|nr:fungal-specific transcription factor domain-containing protein [Xylariomycetidae sp. FL0641]